MISEGRKMVARLARTIEWCRPEASSDPALTTRQAVKLIQDGGIGDVHRIRAGYQSNIYPGLKPTALRSGLTPSSIGTCGSGRRPRSNSTPFAASIISAGSGITRAAR